MQTKMRTTRLDALRRFTVNGGDHARFPIVFLTMYVDGHHLEGQCAFNEDHLAIGAAGNALRLHDERIDVQPAFGQIRSTWNNFLCLFFS